MKNLQKPADFVVAAVKIIALLITPSLSSNIGISGEVAGFLLGCVNWDKERENHIAMAVKNAIRKVKNEVPQGARKILEELLTTLDSPFEIDERIRRSESYFLQSETPQTSRIITEKFLLYFRIEMRQYPDLHLLVSTLNGIITVLNSFEQRLQKHDSTLDIHDQMIQALKAEMERIAKEPVLCLPGMTPGVKLIGRESDLEKFAQEAATKGKICVISGIGGVGKTEFIKTYLQERMDTLGQVGWFEYRGSFRDTLLAVPGLVFHSYAPADDPIAKYNEIMGLLRQLTASDLLVFDNVGKVESTEDINAILALPCKVIFTTREAFDEDRNRLLVYDMTFLSPDACAALFAHYRGQETPEAEQANLREVIRLAGEHTLALELMAKTCKAAGLSVGELLDRLNRDGFNLDGLREEVKREGGRENKRFLEHMLKLYNIADIRAMGEETEWLLANLSVLPLHDFDIKVLIRWLELPDRLLLNQLNDRGWIRIVNGNSVTMHAVIAEVVRASLKPDSECCEKLIDAVTDSIHYSETDVEIYQAPYLNCAKYLLKHIIGERESIAILYTQVSIVQKTQIDYSGALSNFLRAMTICENVLGREHLDTASSYNNVACLYNALGDYENALKYNLQAMAIREKVLGKEHPDTASSYINLANVFQIKHDYMTALKYYLQAIAILNKVLGDEHLDTASSYNNVAVLYSGLGDYENALKYHMQAIAIREKVLGKEHPDTASSYDNLAILYKNFGEYENALKYYLQAMAIREKVLGREHPDIASSFINLANLLQLQGNYKSALKYYLQAMAILERVLGEEHPDTATLYNNLASIYDEQGDYENALKYYLQAMAIREKVLGREHPDIADIYNNLAILYEHLCDYENALKYHMQAMTIREIVLGREHPDTASSYNNLATLYDDQGDYENAMKYYMLAMTIYEKVPGREHLDTASFYNNLATLYDGQGDYENALKYYMQAIAIYEKVLGREHPNTASSYFNLANLYDKQGDFENALKYNMLVMAIREKVLGKENHDTAATYYNLARLFLHKGENEKAVIYSKIAYNVFLAKLGEKHEYTRMAKKLLDYAEEK